MRDAYGNIVRDPEYSFEARYLSFPFSQDRHKNLISGMPLRYSHLIDRSMIRFYEAEFSTSKLHDDECAGGKRFIHFASYPALDDVLIDAELDADQGFLLDYATYGFASQMEMMTSHEILEFVVLVNEMKIKTDRERILARVARRFVSMEEADVWYRCEPIPGFSGATAEHLVSEGRVEDVVDYIDAVDAGGYA